MNTRPPYWVIYLSLLAALLAASFYVPTDTVFAAGTLLENAGTATLTLIDAMTKLVVTLNTAMLGAAATITVKGHEWTPRWTRMDGLLILLVYVCGAVCYFGVYLGYMRLLSMAAAGAINPIETGILWAIRLEYWGVIIGTSLLGLVFARMLEGRAGQTGPVSKRRAPGARKGA